MPDLPLHAPRISVNLPSCGLGAACGVCKAFATFLFNKNRSSVFRESTFTVISRVLCEGSTFERVRQDAVSQISFGQNDLDNAFLPVNV